MLKRVLEQEPNQLRDTYVDELIQLAAKNPNIVALDADLASSSGMGKFGKAYPERFFNCGVAEANMIGVAAGLAAMGKLPFCHSFGTFASRRVCDQIFLSASYAKLNVRIMGSDCGVTAAYNGGTHMPFEDMGVLRSIPEIVLLEACDSVQLRALLRQMAAQDGVFYLRMKRKNVISVFEEGTEFEIGKGKVLLDGTDVTLIASGILLPEAVKAAELLKEAGITARVVNMFTWKPIDEALVADCAAKTGALVTCENHNVIGGLGSAVCEAVCKSKPVPVEMIGVQDVFGQVGDENFLRGYYKLTALDIVSAAKAAIARK